ncbi:MAG TPA: hypothetical protein PLM79_04775 [Syntrophobacteraceae bacterium]|nr:hypothetical protein [Syntrophobacteraceae bacterium]
MLQGRCGSGWFRGLLLLSFLPAALLPSPGFCAAPAPRFEVPINQKASDILPPQFLSGPHFRVRERVVSYGYMHHFTVDSDFGVFETTGDFALRKLVREIGAIAALHQVKRGEAYAQGLKKAASQPLEFGANLVTDPVDTISGIPKGINRLFENVKTGLTSKSQPGEDGKVEQALAVSSNKRELARRLGVDVYSSNSVLQKELNSVAWATTLGSLTLTAALAPVGGPAVAAVSATRTAQQVSDIVNEYPPQRLRQMNEEKLRTMGVSPGLIAQFLDHPVYTPTHDTVIVGCLDALSGAKGREAFLQLALAADGEETANFFQNMAETMRYYHLKVSPLREISVYGPLAFSEAANGTTLISFPLDHGVWTERAAQRVPGVISAYKSAHPRSKNLEVWVTGTLSPMAKKELNKLGVRVVEKVSGQIEFVY